MEKPTLAAIGSFTPLFNFLNMNLSIRLALGLGLMLGLVSPVQAQVDTVAIFAPWLDLEFDEAERETMAKGLSEQRNVYQTLHSEELDNGVPPALVFNPIPVEATFETRQDPIVWSLPETERPAKVDELAFYSLGQLAFLLRSRKITSTQLTRLYLKRLKAHGDTLECVITLLEDVALAQAAQADREIAAGLWRGPLHGIPYGIKDLFAYPGYPTTWGATPYREQMREETATVISKLEKAGAVLVAKLTLGALAYGDVWYGGTTRNPWNLEQGSSGSSAGSASATVAGLVGFAIGTETWGSIVSPSTRCGATGLRPTYGRVSRHGAMALSWTMDKVGPICRHAEDCAMVFQAIQGPDSLDQTLVDLPFNYSQTVDLSQLRIGYARNLIERDYYNRARDSATLATLEGLGAKLIPLDWEPNIPVEALNIILTAEAAAAFDELTRSNRDSLMVRQGENAWPNIFRQGQFISAVAYIQANRHRYRLIQEMHAFMQQVDVLVVPSFGGNQLLTTNLTSHPAVVMPNGFQENGTPVSVTFLGNLYDEATILAVAQAYQQATDFDEQHPPQFQ